MSESDMVSKSRVNVEQLKLMVDFMAQHVEFASGQLRTLEARHESKRLWGEVATLLNGYRAGTQKTADGWSKTWSDFKIKLKNKLIELKRKKLGALKKYVRPMTKLEQRALEILGPAFKKKYIGGLSFDEVICDTLPQIKQEGYQETVTVNGFYREDTDIDRLSDGDSDQSTQSNEDFIDVHAEQPLEDPMMSNIYPKWLVDVEKKRAEADLLRAKADEQRAAVASRRADAALIQAEALKKLADAAERQAEAIQRIAQVLEARKTRDDLLI